MDEEYEGECQEFEAVPGHGLKCRVSGLETYTGKVQWKYSRLMTRQVCINTHNSLMVKDIELGPTTSRSYKVTLTFRDDSVSLCRACLSLCGLSMTLYTLERA